jgi:hypothetical protein
MIKRYEIITEINKLTCEVDNNFYSTKIRTSTLIKINKLSDDYFHMIISNLESRNYWLEKAGL